MASRFSFRAACALLAALIMPLAAAAPAAAKVRNVVLVHGAFADGSSWRKVVPLLQAKGLTVVVVQNPLTSLADDVAATQRILAQQHGPVILVGHSWGGMVITQAGTDPKVAGLVYVAALAPDRGQSVMDLMKDQPPMPASTEFRKDAAGFLSISLAGMRDDFAQDLPIAERDVLAATQAPIAAAAFGQKVDAAAWRAKPSWYIVAGNDRAVSPILEAAMAKAIGATMTTLPTSHLAMLAEPSEVAAVILDAADKAGGP